MKLSLASLALVASAAAAATTSSSASTASLFSTSSIDFNNFFANEETSSTSASLSLSDFWSASSSSSSADSCYCSTVAESEKVCLYLSEPQPLKHFSSSSSSSTDDDDFLGAFRPEHTEGACDMSCQCSGTAPDSSSSDSTSSSSSSENAAFGAGGACAFATHYSAECAMCAHADDNDLHCQCLTGVVAEGYAMAWLDGAAPITRGLCVVLAHDAIIDGDAAGPAAEYLATGTDAYLMSNGDTLYEMILSDFDDTLILAGTFATETIGDITTDNTNFIGTGAGDDIVVAVAGSSMQHGTNLFTEEGGDRVVAETSGALGFVNTGADADAVYIAHGGFINGGLITVDALVDDLSTLDEYDVVTVAGILNGWEGSPSVQPVLQGDIALGQVDGELYVLGCGQITGVIISQANVVALATGSHVSALFLWASYSGTGILRNGANVATIIEGVFGVAGDPVSTRVDAVHYSSSHSLVATFFAEDVDVVYHSGASSLITIVLAATFAVQAHDDVSLDIFLAGGLSVESFSAGNRYDSSVTALLGNEERADGHPSQLQFGNDAHIDVMVAAIGGFEARFGARYASQATIFDEDDAGERSLLVFESDASIAALIVIDDVTVVLSGATVNLFTAGSSEAGVRSAEHYFLCGTTILSANTAGEFSNVDVYVAPSSRVHSLFYSNTQDLKKRGELATGTGSCVLPENTVLSACCVPNGCECPASAEDIDCADEADLSFDFNDNALAILFELITNRYDLPFVKRGASAVNTLNAYMDSKAGSGAASPLFGEFGVLVPSSKKRQGGAFGDLFNNVLGRLDEVSAFAGEATESDSLASLGEVFAGYVAMVDSTAGAQVSRST